MRVLGRIWIISAFMLLSGALAAASMEADAWRREWPRTDFTRHAVGFDEILSGGPPKDGIPAIDRPAFAPVSQRTGLSPNEPVISLENGGEARAYPLRILIWHEIVNDTIGGLPVALTWCPLCNSALVFDRRLGGRVLSFGTTGKLRNANLIMYDRETESWWQQFSGDCIVGTLLGSRLKLLAMRIESFDRFRTRFPDGAVLLAPEDHARPYGRNPYVGYDTSAQPFLYHGGLPAGLAPLARVITVGEEAWSLELLQQRHMIESGDLIISWEPGQASPLDTAAIEAGRNIGTVTVQRRTSHGLEDAAYDVSFAFAFHAFYPDAPIHSN